MEAEKKKFLLVAKRLSILLGTLLSLILIFKFVFYFTPFLIAGIIALIIEPIIKFLMERLHLTRRVSSTIIIIVTILAIIMLISYGGIILLNKLTEIMKELGPFITKIRITFENELSKISSKLEIYVPREVVSMFQESITNFVNNAGIYLENLFEKILKFALSFPTILLNVIVTILALIFFTKDKIYILDMIEHHLPKKWIKNITEILREIFLTVGSYLKVYGKIMLITFTELFLSFSILKAIGFNLNQLLLLSALISLVDVLPVLGVGTILIPWIIWKFTTGNFSFGIALTIIYIFILIVRQLVEPKLVSKQLGIHPIVTLFAMYAGFKTFGFIGLILGPFLLMILKSIFNRQIEKGFFKYILGTEEK